MASVNSSLKSGKQKKSGVITTAFATKLGKKMGTTAVPRRKAASLSSSCHMYRPAGLSTIHESWRSRPIRTRAVHSDSSMPVKRSHGNTKGDVSSSAIMLGRDRRKEATACSKEVVYLMENQSKRMKQAQAIYLNTKFHTMRFESLREKILKAHETKIRNDITQATNAINKRTEDNATRLKELCGVREKFFNERKSRLNRTHVSLNAVEMPEVSRYAYGLPAEGQEFDMLKNPDPEKAKRKYRQLWKRTMKKATNAINIVKSIGEKQERGIVFPNIIVKKTAKKKISKGSKSSEIENEHKQDDLQNDRVKNNADDIYIVSPVSLSYDLDEDSPLESDLEYD